MNRYKKRTIALILASVITVIGTFGSENYKNNLLNLKFSETESSTDIILETQVNYDKKINLTKINPNTYVIMLPEVKESLIKNPELPRTIDKIDIKTMPYTKNNIGYTKITVKTLNNSNITAKNILYIPTKETPQLEDKNSQKSQEIEPNHQEKYNEQKQYNNLKTEHYQTQTQAQTQSRDVVDINKTKEQFNQNTTKENLDYKTNKNIEENDVPDLNNFNTTSEDNYTQTETEKKSIKTNVNHSEIQFILLGILLVLITTVFFYVKGKNKIAEILGEQVDFDINEEETGKKTQKEKSTKKDIKSVINKLDKTYPPANKIATPTEVVTTNKQIEVVESENIVDLDEILNTQNNENNISENGIVQIDTQNTTNETDETENLALEEFLKAYTFEDEEKEEEKEQILFNEELYSKYINDNSINFSKEDITKIEKLLNTEINDDTIKNIDQFLVTNPQERKVSRTELLENLVSTYTINQNIVFSEQDIEALNKLMNVELDNDFITDLRTNPERIKIMQDEIKNQKIQPHKKSEILTLNVKDMLPNLSEALKKQGNKQIESEYKPQVVYYSEGYDVNVISLKDQLPDLSIEINNKESYATRPSDEIEYSVTGYEVDKLSVSEEFLDLDAMLKQQEKLDAIKSAPVEVDEEALLKNITNVTFKPFYSEEENTNKEEAPSFSDIQAEFKELGNVEIIKEDNDLISSTTNENDDFESLFSNEYFDLDKSAKTDSEQEISINKSTNAQELLNIIEQKQAEKQEKIEEQQNKQAITDNETKTNQEKNEIDIKESVPNTCIVDNSIYEIVSTTNFTEKMGCYLAKNNSGYCILGFVGEKLFKIKYYEKLKSEKIQARKTDKIDNNIDRYIVRIGIHKFIMNVSQDNMEYIMDLC